MTDHDDGIDAARAALIEKNIDLAFRFLKELIDDPEKIGQVPSGSTVYVMSRGEPEFNRIQMARAQRAAESGRLAHLWQLDAPPGERSALEVRTTKPRWPTEGLDPVALYDRAKDLLVVDFFGRRRAGVPIPTDAFGILFVDLATDEIVVHVLPAFLSQAVPRDPTLIDVLLRPETVLEGITRDEVRAIRNALAHHGVVLPPVPAPFEELTEHLQLLTA